MKTLTRFLAIAAAAAMILAVTQRTQIGAARAELARLEASAPVRIAESPAEPPAAAVTRDDIARLRATNRDIHKLRGQISQAREKRRALERMEAENARLREKIAHFKANPDAASSQPLPFSNKGQSTPEAALETTFWSMHQGDIEGLSRLMPMVTAEFQRMPADEKTNHVMMLRAMAGGIAKFEITDRKSDSPDEAHLTLRITRRENLGATPPSGPDEATFVLRRTNDIWQIVAER